MNARLENCRKHKRKSETPIVKGGDLKTIGVELNKPIVALNIALVNGFLLYIERTKIEILNSTFRQYSGIYLCMNGFYSFTCQCYTFPALLTAAEGGSP